MKLREMGMVLMSTIIIKKDYAKFTKNCGFDKMRWCKQIYEMQTKLIKLLSHEKLLFCY